MSVRRLTHARLAAGLSLLAALGACVVPAARVPVDSLSSLASDETIVVGRVELVPPLHKDEQKIKGIVIGDVENKIFLLTDEQYRVLTKEPEIADFAGRIEAKIGKNFFVRSHNKPFYILGGMLYLELGGREMSRVYFPGGMKVPLRSGDKAVYVGTVQYHRDEFFDIKKVAILDDCDRGNAEYKKKFRSKQPLRKALLTTVK